ncbi:MAG: flippase [Armatimonadetes bacterium]|nr:flippase [Armatimonadota bacterium]
MNRHRVARNLLATLATQLISWALTFAVMLYLPRYVGDAGLGQLTFAASLAGFFGVLVPLGTSTVLVKEIARDRGRTGELLTAALLLRVPLGLAMTGLAIAAVGALGYSGLIRTLVTVAALGMVVGALNDALASALQGQENLPRQSAAVLVEKFLSSGLTVALVLHKAPLWTLAAVGLFTGAASLLVNLTAFRALLPTLRWPDWTTVRYVAVAGLPFMGWTVFRTLYGQTDPIVLKLLTNDATVGWYSAAFRLVGTTMFLPTAITTALLPTLSRLHQESEEDFARLARRTLAFVMLCGVPVSFVLLAMPERLIALMHYPARFAHSVPVLRVGGLGVLLWFAAAVLGTLVIARDAQGRMFRASVWATLLGVPACFLGTWLGSRLWGNGAVGAIASDVALEAFLLGAYWRMLPRGLLGRESLSLMGRCVAASLPMAGFLMLVAHYLPVGAWVAVPCTLIYMLMCWGLRCLGPQDMALARSVLVRKAEV